MSITCNICGKPQTKTGEGKEMFFIESVSGLSYDKSLMVVFTPVAQACFLPYRENMTHICGRCIAKLDLKRIAAEQAKREKERREQNEKAESSQL